MSGNRDHGIQMSQWADTIEHRIRWNGSLPRKSGTKEKAKQKRTEPRKYNGDLWEPYSNAIST